MQEEDRSAVAPSPAAAAPQGLFGDARALLQLALRQAGTLRRVVAAMALVVAVGVASLFVLSYATGMPMALLTRDVAATTGAKFYTGILSSVGALVWCASATACLFAAAALRGAPGQGERARFLGAVGVLQAALGGDDFFMLHEVVYPKLGLVEEVVVALYALALAALLLRFRRHLLDSEVLLFLLGALLFGGSVLVDLAVRDATALEDILKVAGVATWLTYFWRHALSGLRAARSRADGVTP
jgi:hypothetical protein